MSRGLEFPTLYQTAPHPCPYIGEQTAINLILDPNYRVDGPMYNRLLSNGFRRNGSLFYRPFCNNCAQCQSVRVPVQRFVPSRSQRRNIRRNQDLRLEIVKPRFDREQFELYLKYQALRHPGDSMDDPDPSKYQRFLVDSNVETHFLEFRLNDTLLAVSIVDRISDALSAIYCYFDPFQGSRGLGTFAILKQIELAQQLGLRYLYLGYWIDDCRKMSYKKNFQPLESYDTVKARWSDLSP